VEGRKGRRNSEKKLTVGGLEHGKEAERGFSAFVSFL